MPDQNRSPPTTYPMTPWRERVFAEIDAYLEKLGRSQEESRLHLAQFFDGHISRHQLTDHQLTQLSRRLDWEANTLDKYRKKP
jgi:hypothetical protein